MHRRKFIGMLGLGSLGAAWRLGAGEDKSGPGLVLQFDDGWANWTETIAPELDKAGGKATGFVCNQYVDSGRVSLEALRKLQDEFGWEIGSHAYRHLNAPRYVARHGVEKWLEKELDASLAALRKAGLHARSLAFPFNALTPELAQAVKSRVESYRRAEPLAMAPGIRPDGSVPGTTIDIAQYTPVNIVKSWLDFAARKKQVLFLYGHRVLPDDRFARGSVTGIADEVLTVDRAVNAPEGEALVLVPNPERRASRRAMVGIVSVEGRKMRVDGVGDLKVGDRFIVGPTYGTPLSDFRSILAHAKGKLPFYTIHEIVRQKHLTRK